MEGELFSRSAFEFVVPMCFNSCVLSALKSVICLGSYLDWLYLLFNIEITSDVL